MVVERATRHAADAEPVTSPRASGFRGTASAVLAFGLAFGFVEAAVVVYLQGAIGTGAVPPAASAAAFATYEAVETLREAATLVMIAAVGWLAGRTGLERLAWAAVVFGTWDITYYAGLWWAIGWPSALDTWDVLFLIPTPWVGPVWAPIAVSVALVGAGLAAAARSRAGHRPAVGRLEVLLGLAGGGLVVASFLVDSTRVLGGDASPWSGWPLFWLGMALAVVGAARALRRGGAPSVDAASESLARLG